MESPATETVWWRALRKLSGRVLDMDRHHIRPDGPSDLLRQLPLIYGRTAMTYLRRVGYFLAAYTCRGCGTEITNKGAFKKCPVCGIKWE